MAKIIRTKEETVAEVSSASKKITVNVKQSLTVEESRELRKLLKAEEEKARKQSANVWGIDIGKYAAGFTYTSGF